MAVLGRLLISSAERLDLPDLLSIDSYAGGDWKYFLKGLVGDDKPYILNGFDVIDPNNAIGTQSCSIRVADSVVFYPGSNAGAFFHGLAEGNALSTPLVPELRKNAVNYVYLTLSTTNTSVDSRAFWDPDKDGGVGGEFTQDVNTESVLKVDINVSVGSFPANTVPVAIVTVGPVTITKIEDARDLFYRLGSGGIAPNPFNSYAWKSEPAPGYERTEPPTAMVAGGVNPFEGADKNINSLKEWMDAIMSKLRELGGTTYWYQDASTFSLITNFVDAMATTFKSKGHWLHDSSVAGLLTWTEDINIKITSDPRSYIIRAGSKNLADEQVAYISMIRKQPINVNDQLVAWTNGQPYVNTIGGAVGLFANLTKGDWIKKVNDPDIYWLRVEEFYDSPNLGGSTTIPANAKSVRLSSNYLGVTGNEKGRYDRGVYASSDIVVSNRDAIALANAGGNFNWMAIRSDTIENIGNVVTTSLTLDITNDDGTRALCTSSSAHGLVDGDRITVVGSTNYDDTYQVEVVSTTEFYISISGGPFPDETGVSAFYATITTAARSTPYGLQLESANHGFATDETIIIGDTTNYDGSYKINVINATTFTIPVSSALATETAGTATLARVIVRMEDGSAEIIQGESAGIGDSAIENIKQYLGMQSLAEVHPLYRIPDGYNALNGMQNFNSAIDDDITIRVSKLTAMMADKAQDKLVRYLPSPDLTTVTNTTNGLNQEITFSPSGSLTLMLPGSPGTTVVTLPTTSPGINLGANQVAYVLVNRNAATTPTIQISDIATTVVNENMFVIASRLVSTDVYLWDGSIVNVGSQPVSNYLVTVVRQNQDMKLVDGGTWSYTGSTLTWNSDAYVQIPGLANSANIIPAGSVSLTSGEVAYVDINRVGPGGSLTPVVIANTSLVLGTNRFIIAREENGDVIVGLHSMRLISGESKTLYSGASDQTLAYIGATDEADLDPNYTSPIRNITQSQDLTSAISSIDTELDKFFGQLKLVPMTPASTRVAIRGADYTMLDGTTISQEISNLLIKFDGAQIDFATGNVYEADGMTPLGVNFTPAVIPANQYHWYSVSLVPSSVTADSRLNVQCIVISAVGSGASASAAPRAAFGGTKKLGQVYVYNPGSGIAAINAANIVQLGVGSGSGSGNGFQEVDLHDVYSTTLPTGTGANIDGVNLVDGMKVLFSNLVSGNNEVYQVSGVGTSLSWTAQNMFDMGSTSPQNGATILVLQGTAYHDQIGIFNETYWSFGDIVRQFNIFGDYYEVSSPRKISLNPSTTDVVFQVATTGSENFIVDYSVVRGLNKETGHVYVTHNGTIANASTAASYIGFTGVGFTADINSGNVRLLYTADGSAGTPVMTFSVKRWSDASGGPASSLPSYTVSSIVANGSSQTAYVMSDNSGLPVNCTATFNMSGKTRVTLANPYVMNVLPGTTYSDIEVYVDGQFMPRFVSGVTQDDYFKEIDSTTIEFNKDLTTFPVSIEVRKRLYVGNITPVVNKQYALYKTIVGSSAQVTSGAATHTSIQQAITDSSAGDSILVLSGTYTENIALNKSVTIEGQGFNTKLNGSFTITANVTGSYTNKINFGGNIAIDVTSSYNYIIGSWRLSANTLVDSGIGNVKQIATM